MRTALITGASRGLGLVLADYLATDGWRLVVTARGHGDLVASASRLERRGAPVEALAGDVSDPAHRAALVEAAGPGLELLVNNASDLGTIRPLASTSREEWRRVLEVNLIAPVALTVLAAPSLAANGGLVVNMSSDAAVGGYEGWGVYGSSKAALDLAGATLAAELGPEGVAVVTIDPGDMRTQMHQRAFPGEDISDRPLPEATLPFWAWLLGQGRPSLNGRRLQAQAPVWEVAS